MNRDNQAKNQKIQESIKRILGEPLFVSLPDYVLKLRRNLIALSFIALIYKLSGTKIIINNKITLYGFTFAEVEQHVVDLSLFVFLVYSLCHYGFELWETFLRWKIRLGGTFKEVQKDSAITAKQRCDSGTAIIDRINLRDIGYCYGEQSYLYSVLAQIISYNTAVFDKEDEVNKFEATKVILLTVKEGLKRYQEGFEQFQIMQMLRFIIFDIIFPLIISISLNSPL